MLISEFLNLGVSHFNSFAKNTVAFTGWLRAISKSQSVLAIESSRASSQMRSWSAASLSALKLDWSPPHCSCIIRVLKDLLATALGHPVSSCLHASAIVNPGS
jgi:hypothetical protein